MSRTFSFLFIFLFTTARIFSQSDLNSPITADPDVKTGRLENGMVYYIRKNLKPENRVELRLAVNAGSILETEGQKGLAHFVEHMCFNGTKNFPKNDLVDYLQETGVKFGADINAYTSFDETVYMLQLPADNKELLDKGFLVLEDWAHNVSFDGKEIDKERGVIVEEWRMGLGAEDRMRKKYFPVVFKNSRYAERLPIGDIDVIRNFRHDTLRSFYKDWYRPSLQAIIVVGDIDVFETEKQIISHFSKVANPPNPRERVTYDIPDNEEPLISIVTDKEATTSSIMVFYKHPSKVVKTKGDYRFRVMRELYSGMLNARFREKIEQPESPFIYAYNSYGRFLARARDAFTINAQAKENKISNALEALLTECERARRYGFTQGEMERQKAELFSRYERLAKEYDKTESARYAREYVGNFLSGDPMPGIRTEFEMVKEFLPSITLEEVNAFGKTWVTDKNTVVVITAPEKEGLVVPSVNEVNDIIEKVKNIQIDTYVDQVRDEPLIHAELKPAGIAYIREHKNPDHTEVMLDNGIRIIIKATDFKNDEILFSGISPGGHSRYPDQDYLTAIFAQQIISQSGIGNFTKTELDKKLKGKNVELSPYIDVIKEGFNGKASPRDLETLFQLTWLYFTSPRHDSSAFVSFISRTKSQMKFIRANPVYTFMDTLVKTSSSNGPRVVVLPREEQLNQISLDRAFSIYSDRFADAGDFTFLMVGNVNTDSVLPLVTKYFGNLPVTRSSEEWKDVSSPFPPGITEVEVFRGTEPKSMVAIVIQDTFSWNDNNRIYLRMLKEIISIRLIQTIREQMSGVYSPQVQMTVNRYPKPEFSMMIMFGCSPDNYDRLTKAVLKIFDRLRKKGSGEEDLIKVKELLLRERETDLKSNKFWLSRLESVYFNQDNPSLLTEYYNELVSGVTSKQLKDAACRFFVKGHYVRGVLLPEKPR